ncbi:MAG TPA: ABC transporter permease [Kofleriaceae bacterium]|nr:ABC transporter permease [Kofleriaceae bacterium]
MAGTARQPETSPETSIERRGGLALVHLRGDVDRAATPGLYRNLERLARRRDVEEVVLDFSAAGRIDTSGVAVASLASRLMARAGKRFDLQHLDPHHRAAFELLPSWDAEEPPPPQRESRLEAIGERVLGLSAGARRFAGIALAAARESLSVLARRRRLPSGSLVQQAAAMGADAVAIVAVLSLLLGMTLAFQGAVQLEQFGADLFVADLVGLSMVREFGPLMTAVILTGRTGAAIAAELGTMRVRDEIAALEAMGISPVRYLVVPRLAALTAVQPALTLLSIAVGIGGGILIASASLDLSPVAFWDRMVTRLTLGDFGHGLGKAVVFAWIIGLTGSTMGLRARGGASSVGTSTTRAVVSSIFLIVVVDSAFATLSAIGGARWQP